MKRKAGGLFSTVSKGKVTCNNLARDMAKLKAARLAQERAEMVSRQVEENQLKKLQSLTLLPESDPVIYSKYDFLASLGLTMSMS